MKVVILAGGFGTRLSEETSIKPKPMVEIGGKPILWHIMKIYSHYGFNDFIICLGYKGEVIKEYFINYYIRQSDITVDLSDNLVSINRNFSEPWKITLVDTGKNTMTGGRLLRIKGYVEGTFMMTYGDGVGNVNIQDLLTFHRKMKKYATVTSTQPADKFGVLDLHDDNIVRHFNEKPAGDGVWINAGFFVLEPEIFNYIKGNYDSWEREPLEKIATEGQLAAFKHLGFWMAMDKLSDKKTLEELWKSGNAKWKIW